MVEPWAAQIVHDGPTETWRVAALLAKDGRQLWSALSLMPVEDVEKLPTDVQVAMRQLYIRLEMTDYFLSGVLLGQSQ